MFIGLCGSICSGKGAIADYLVDAHHFREVTVKPALKMGWDKSKRCLNFASYVELLDHLTKNWRERWVTADVVAPKILDEFERRPFFLLISVDAPMNTRWLRYQRKHGIGNGEKKPRIASSLVDFVRVSDLDLYDDLPSLLAVISRASIRILNTSSNLAELHATLDALDLSNPDRLRPNWDMYFMSLASLAAQRSNCMKRRVGCVVVRDRRVISTGYNGTPRGLLNCGEGGCDRCNAGEGSGQGLATCLCLHAEENALLEAGRERLSGGAVLYCDTCPCLTCSIKIVQVGIQEVVYSKGYSMDGQTAAVFAEGGVKLRQFVPPANGLIRVQELEEDSD